MKPRPPIERGSPVTRITIPACRAHYPGGSNRCACRLLPHPCGLPRIAGGSASAALLSRPAQASLALRPVGLLNRPRRPLSRGFDPAGYPAKPLVSYQSNRQFPGWNPPPLVTRAIGAHCKMKIHLFEGSAISDLPAPPQIVMSLQENNLLLRGLDCLLFARAFVKRRTQRRAMVRQA